MKLPCRVRTRIARFAFQVSRTPNPEAVMLRTFRGQSRRRVGRAGRVTYIARTVLSCAWLALVGCHDSSSPQYFVGGNVSGLSGGTVLLKNGTDTLTVAIDGPFKFA